MRESLKCGFIMMLQKIIRKNVGRSLLVEDLRRESNKTPVPLRRSQAQPMNNPRGMMGSKSL